MTILKPYLVRAVYEWIVDNDMTPYLLVDSEYPNAVLPQQFAKDGQIVLNIRPLAVEALSLGNEAIEFNTRFNGKSTYINAPINAVLAIYAKENGKGMAFDPNDLNNRHDDSTPPPPEPPPKSKPTLKVVR